MFKVVRNQQGEIISIETSLTGAELLSNPRFNKGCAFTREEREMFNLEGLLPYQVETLEQQVTRMYAQYQEQPTNLAKNIYLNMLHDYNKILFYKLVSQHLEEMLPIIYTPTVGEIVQRFSLEHRKSRGLYIDYPERNQIDAILDNRVPRDVDMIVVSDGEGVLGIGDQGIGGIHIASAKLMVYTLCAGINPHRVLPIQLDVGTNNPDLLTDPIYLGWRHERISGASYDEFIEMFVNALLKKFPHFYLHWEDFGRDNARRILNHYREKICTINGDIQSTGVVALACVLAAAKASGISLKEHRIVIFGAGTAGVGVADQIAETLQRQGLSTKAAQAQLWLIDKTGLLTDQTPSLLPFQKPYARAHEEVKSWKLRNENFISLYDVVKNVKPTILIGASAVPGAFTEEVITTMAAQTPRPIIMPLSNPNSHSEATPKDLLAWTNGKGMIATGSPFPAVVMGEKTIRIAQSNNAFAFPGIGLGAIASKARLVTDEMLWAATQALSERSPIHQDPNAPLLPKLSEILEISRHIALAVGEEARKQGLAQIDTNIDLKQAIKQVSWEPRYLPYQKK